MRAPELVDQQADDVVVVYGSPPPEGRDLDLLVRETTAATLANSLSVAGYRRHGHTYARFTDGTVDAVDLRTPGAWKLAPEAQDDLFARAVLLPGRQKLARPAPAHLLLIEARRLARGDGTLKDSSRRRIADALADDPASAEEARRLAPAWGLALSLQVLLDTVAGRPVPADRREAARLEVIGTSRPSAVCAGLKHFIPSRRGVIVAFSGLDGSGKSGQARALAANLRVLGFETVVVWTRLGSGARLRRLGGQAKGLLAPLLRASPDVPGQSRYAEHAASPDPVRSSRERSQVLTFAWAFVVVLDHLVEQRGNVRRHLRAGRVVISDRWTLDSVAHLRYRYGASTPLFLHELVLRAFAPRPRAAFLLEVPGAVAHARKSDQYDREQLERQARHYRDAARRLGIEILDGTRSIQEIADAVGTRAWPAVAQASGRAALRQIIARGPGGGMA